jgi:hypothetical protein
MFGQTQYTLATLGLLVIATLGGCSGSDSELIDYVTFGAGLPPNSRVVATKRDSGFAQDGRLYLIFDTDSAGIATFTKAYTGGTLDSMKRSRTELNGATSSGTWMDTVDNLPWDLAAISNGRFSRHASTNGFLSIDLSTNRVYVFR